MPGPSINLCRPWGKKTVLLILAFPEPILVPGIKEMLGKYLLSSIYMRFLESKHYLGCDLKNYLGDFARLLYFIHIMILSIQKHL